MPGSVPATRFAGLPRGAAMSAFIIAILATLLFLGFARIYHDPTVPNPSDGGDRAMYMRLVDDMQHGKDYYAAARQELSAGHYGMRSVFNWRTPTLASFLAWFPDVSLSQGLLFAAAVLATGMACRLVWYDLGWIGVGSLVIVELLSLGVCVIPTSIFISEIPTGVLILLSASAYGVGQRRLGFAAGVLALFIRELAAPYVLVCAFLAWRERRYGELGCWLLAFLVYAAYFAWHFHMVQLHQSPTDHADPSGWLQLGGAAFVLSTAAFNGFFLAAPLWASALLLPFGYLGLLAWPGPAGRRIALTVTAYLAFFAVAGKPFDGYWGAIYTPLLSMGLVWVPAAVRDLWGSLRPNARDTAIALN